MQKQKAHIIVSAGWYDQIGTPVYVHVQGINHCYLCDAMIWHDIWSPSSVVQWHGVEKPGQVSFGMFSLGGERSKRPQRAIVQTYKYHETFDGPGSCIMMHYHLQLESCEESSLGQWVSQCVQYLFEYALPFGNWLIQHSYWKWQYK